MRMKALVRRLAAIAMLCCQAAWAAPPGPSGFNTRFVAIAFHDVVDPGQPADFDAVSVDKFVAFLDWLKADGWTPVTTADIDAAAKGRKALPAKAILLSFDDGYASFYHRVYPLLLAYRYPAVISLVGQWMDQPPGSAVDYAGRQVPREHFLSWDQVRRMQASGLIEVASHTYDLHRTVQINRQGNTAGAARAWVYDRTTGLTETDRDYVARVSADLARSREAIARETGIAPHVLVWPYGTFSSLAADLAQSLGFDQIYNLSPEAADAREPLQIPRYYPTRDPDLGEIVENLWFQPDASPTARLACVDLSALAAARDPAEQDAVLGRMIEDVRRLGPNIVIIEALRYSADGSRPVASWLRTSLLPVEADILSRAARQLGTRADVDVYVRLRLPSLVAAFGEKDVIELARQIERSAPITGLALDGSGWGGSPERVLSPAEIRRARQPANAGSSQILRVMRGAMEIGGQSRLIVLAGADGQAAPPNGADMIVWPPALTVSEAAAQAAHLKATGWFEPGASGRVLLSVPHLAPKLQAQSIRAMQVQGANAFALCPWSPGHTGVIAPAFSAATFPYRP